MPSSSIGLYLGTDTLEFIQLAGSFQHPRLVSVASAPLSSTALKGAATGEELLHSLQALLQKSSIPAGRTYVAVPPEAAVTRYFQMPTIPPRERKMAVTFEAKKYLPFKLEELVTDFQVVTSRVDPALMRIMFFGLQKPLLNTFLTALRSASVIPLCLEPAPVSLMRLMRQSGQLPPGQVGAILTVEKDTATITIARSDLLYLSRNVSMLTPPENGQTVPSQLIEALIHETRVSIDYYRRRFLGEPGVAKIILFGHETNLKRVEELTAALDLPVEVGAPFKRVILGKESPVGFSVATGLALRGLERKAGEINLLLPEFRRDLQGIGRSLAARVALSLAVLLLWYGYTLIDSSAHEQRILALRQQQPVPEGIPAAASLADLQRIQQEKQGQVQFLKELSKTQGSHTALLKELARLLPEEAWLQHTVLEDTMAGQSRETLNSLYRKRALRVVGGSYAQNRDKELEGVNSFLTALRENPKFTSAFTKFSLDTVQRARFQDEEITEFRLTCLSHPEGQR